MFDSFPLLGTSSWAVVCVTTVVAVLYFALQRRSTSLPPGPRTVPGIGNMHRLLGDNMAGRLRGLRRTYGDVYRLYLGQQLVIVLSGSDTIQEALVKRGAIFAARPPTLFGKLSTSVTKRTPTLIFGEGQVWKEHRSFAMRALQKFGFSSKAIPMEERINREIDALIERLAEKECSLDINKPLTTSVGNIIISIIFGRRFDHDDSTFQTVLNKFDERAKALGTLSFILNSFPWTRFLVHLPGDILNYKRITGCGEHIQKFFGQLVDESMVSFSENSNSSFVDLYLKEMEGKSKNRDERTFDVPAFKSLCNDLLAAGMETTATTIRWLILYLLKNPEIQRKLHNDIDGVVGRGERPTLDDRARLPYAEATIMETLGIAPAALLAVPHSVPHDVMFHGHLIPKNTTIITNLESVLKDPDVWSDPDEFSPERYLTADGSVQVPKEFIPFSLGRRSCVGESLARAELFLFTTRLLQKFEFRVPDGEPLPDCQGILRTTYRPKPFDVILKKR